MSWVGDLLGQVGDIVDAVVETGADVVEDAAAVVEDVVEDGVDAVNEFFCEQMSLGCQIANALGGLVVGTVRTVRLLLEDLAHVAVAVGHIVSSAFRLDLIGLVRALADLGMALVILGANLIRGLIMGNIASAIYERTNRSALRRFVAERIVELFGDDPNRVAELRDRIGLSGFGRWGIVVPAEHRILYLDSANTPLHRLHTARVIDLYAMAGFRAGAQGRFTRTGFKVRTVDANGRDHLLGATRGDLDRHIASQGQLHRVRVYALSRRGTARRLRIAKRSTKPLGVLLRWNDSPVLAFANRYTNQEIQIEVESDTVPEDLHPLFFRRNRATEFLREVGLRRGRWEEECRLKALGVFFFDNPQSAGQTYGRRSDQGPVTIGQCRTPPDRDDSCCVRISTMATDEDQAPEGTGVAHRHLWPDWMIQYVLAHEIGHWLGLCHFGHSGFSNIMFTKESGQGVNAFSWNLLWRLYASLEPTFTPADGRNAWRYLLNQWAAPGRCL